jgi:hypothetical protein
VRRRAFAAPALAVLLCTATATLAATPPPHAYAAGDPHQCAPDARWCVGAFMKHGRRFLDIGAFDMHGRYQVCVTPPRAGERCKSFTLVRNATGANASSVAFTKHFPHARRGRYAVRWLYQGRQVGPVLRFSHPA